ncbi:hypothetical protein [Candidatus Cyanaurora vandensis]|uniref:hypothetical protein n=1 Tax=Candidatus Cyanaurora vandensis TaxID=2714958 RepID=UPI00257C9126|nr:hypothetical protein [Candidatus Cyanaurora vandensis]
MRVIFIEFRDQDVPTLLATLTRFKPRQGFDFAVKLRHLPTSDNPMGTTTILSAGEFNRGRITLI